LKVPNRERLPATGMSEMPLYGFDTRLNIFIKPNLIVENITPAVIVNSAIE